MTLQLNKIPPQQKIIPPLHFKSPQQQKQLNSNNPTSTISNSPLSSKNHPSTKNISPLNSRTSRRVENCASSRAIRNCWIRKIVFLLWWNMVKWCFSTWWISWETKNSAKMRDGFGVRFWKMPRGLLFLLGLFLHLRLPAYEMDLPSAWANCHWTRLLPLAQMSSANTCQDDMQKIDIKLEEINGTQGAEAFLQVFFAEARRSRCYAIIFLISSILWIAHSHIENSGNQESFSGLLPFLFWSHDL